ncbi:ROK family protein [Oerskovia sp. Sa1BUA8]|uniref:ROK family protein n=2 Tax=Oerskovia douganii TaxID=2762210 RepID=A0A9D5YYZ3_9CELL|nr:ROK family protein [Oerskovia douganii]
MVGEGQLAVPAVPGLGPPSHAGTATGAPGAGLRRAVIALDVGGTDIKSAIVTRGSDPDALDEILVERVTSTRAADGPGASVAAVLAAVETLRAEVPAGYQVLGVGLAVPGTVDESAGLVVSAENLDWVDLPLRKVVADATGLPVGFGHDVRAGGLAEARLGAGRGAPDHAYVSIGTGIAAAVVLHGQVYVGGGYAGEIGHGGTHGGAPCACGGTGCAETFASAAGIARSYRELTGATADEVPGSAEVLARAHAGDTVARQVWDRAIDRLGELVADMVRLLALPVVVIGGGLVRAGEDLMVPLDAAVRSYLTIHPAPRLVPATLGSAAGTYGASVLAWDAVTAAALEAL